MNQSQFVMEIEPILKPKFEQLGFKKILLKDCMCPELLFNKEGIWFGASWDYRDQYLELELGNLFWFQDVMPRVIIIGEYKSYCSQIESLSVDMPTYFKRLAEIVRGSIDSAIEVYEKRYKEIHAARLNPENLKYPKEFYSHLGKEVSWNELDRFIVRS